MEEKERLEWNSRFDEAIKDNQTGDIVNAVEVLNKQDKRIKELEEENRYLEKIYEELIIDRRDLCLERNDIFEENQQLKQSQKQLAIEKLEKMREKFGYRYNSQLVISSKYLSDFIDNQIKSLKGE